MEGFQFRVQGAGTVHVAVHRRLTHGGHLRRRHIGGHRDVAVAAGQNQLQGGGVVAGIDQEIVAAALTDFPRALQVAGGFLDADDVRHLGETLHGFRQQVAGGAAGHVVENLRDVHRPGHGQEMLIEAFLGRLVVVRRHQQAGVGAVALGVTGKADGFLGAVGAGTGDHRNPFVGHRHDLADHTVVFLEAQGGGLTGGAHRHDSMGALLHMPVDQTAQTFPVHRSVFAHGGYHCHDAAANHAASS